MDKSERYLKAILGELKDIKRELRNLFKKDEADEALKKFIKEVKKLDN